MIPIGDLILDDEIRPRAAISERLVGKFVGAMESGAACPPIEVVYSGDGYWLVDGFHRVEAATRLGRRKIEALVHQGDRRDALLKAAAANQLGGAPRTPADKRRAAMRLLLDEAWSRRSDGAIARQIGVGQPFVSKLRRGLPAGANPELGEPTRIGLDARSHDMARVGRRPRRLGPAATAGASGPGLRPTPEEIGRGLAATLTPDEFDLVIAAYHAARGGRHRSLAPHV